MGFYLTFVGSLVFPLVTRIIPAFGIDLGSEGDPFAVRGPDRLGGASGNLCYLFLVSAVVIHYPNLAAGHISNLLSVGRPARRSGRAGATGQLFRLAARKLYDVDLSDRAVVVEPDVADRKRHAPAIR